LQDAFNLEKPILGICFGAQTLNVWRGGSLVQHLTTATDHAPGRAFLEAHRVTLQSGTRLARMVPHEESLEEAVNSSHHQAISDPGDNLIVSAKSLNDGVIEAIELDSQSHFVVGIQWHPERTYIQSALSRSIFSAFIHAAQAWKPRQVELSTAR
jgi:putative glutamine amidotransferase